jgi:hypothetical protein
MSERQASSDTDTDTFPDRRPDVPQKWKSPEYDNVLRLDLLGTTLQEIADTLGYSKQQVKRVRRMPEYRELKAELLNGEVGSVLQKVKVQLATLLPSAVDVYEGVMSDEKARDRDRLGAADSVMDRFIPKRSRNEVDAHVAGQPIQITITTSADGADYMREAMLKDPEPVREAEYTIIDSGDGRSERALPTPQPCDLCGEQLPDDPDDHMCVLMNVPPKLQDDALHRNDAKLSRRRPGRLPPVLEGEDQQL